MSEIDHHDLYEEEPLPEGEEKAPPLTHTMGIVRWGILGAMAIFALVMLLGFFGLAPWTESSNASTQYHCPMHPTYIANQPGDCPICGMSLVPIEGEKKSDSATASEGTGNLGKVSIAKPGQYYCPMDPEIALDTAGRCSMCGMFLEKFEPGMKFTCEMHPEVITDHPGDCPKCGMDLIPVQTTSEQHSSMSSEIPSQSVPGLVTVMIAPQRLQLIGLRTGKVERRSIAESKRLVGYIVPDESKIKNVSVRVSGWVRELLANETGQSVYEGEKLLTLYSQELYQAVSEYRLALQGNDQRIVDASRSRLNLLGLGDKEIDRMAKGSDDASILALSSPVSGIVLSKNVLSGQFVSPSENLMTIADLRTVWVIADIYESDLASLKIGQAAEMSVTGYPGEKFEGTVSFIYPTISTETRTAKVRISFANREMKLKPGMYAEVSLLSKANEVLAVPTEAILDGGEIAYVFVAKADNEFEPRRITVGQRTNDWIEILSGLSENDKVVTSANFLIDSESRLQAAISGMGKVESNPHEGHGK